MYHRHRRWSLDGTWETMLGRLQAGCDEAEGKDWTLSADSTVVRAHQHAAGPGTRCPRNWSPGAPPNDNNPPGRPGREALGRSRGGLSTKIHLAADLRCRPVTRILTPGQYGDCPQFIPLLDHVRVARRGKGRPRTRPGRAMADKAYSSAANRAYLRRRGIAAVIPVKEDQKKHRRARGRGGGRPPAFDPARYKDRNTVERCFSKLKQFRAVATRYDKRDFMYQATVDVASIRIWLRDPVP
jgi:transposase